jgi:hypothetical protein
VPYPHLLLRAEDFPDIIHPSGAVLDILQILAEFLLNIEYEDLILSPQIMLNKNGEREISTYATATEFEKICKVVTDQYGEGVYPIVLQFNGDGMAVDGLGMVMFVNIS